MELSNAPRNETEKPPLPQLTDGVFDGKSPLAERADVFSDVLDRYWFKKDGKPHLKDVCDDYFRPYREGTDSFRAALEDPDSAPVMLESMRNAYVVYRDRIDDREWQDRSPAEDHLKEFLSRSVVESLDVLDVHLRRDDLDSDALIRMKNNVLYIVSEALDSALPENRRKLESWIDAHLEDIARLDPTHQDLDGRIDGTPLRMLENISKRIESAETFDRLLSRIPDIYRNCPSSDRNEVIYAEVERLLLGLIPSKFRFHDKVARSIAERIGLDPKIVDKWKESMVYVGKDPQGEALYRPSYLENIDATFALEMKSKGASEQLFKDFGVANFSRYNREMLLRQLEKEDDDVPYGLVVYPEADHNGAFAQNVSKLAEVALKLRMGGLETRVIEVGSQKELARRLITLHKKYSPAGNKIGFAIIGGHGTESSVAFGEKVEYSSPPPFPEQENYLTEIEAWKRRALTGDRGAFTTNDLEGAGIKRAAETFFDEKAPVVLVSCSTGVEGGIAEKTSGSFGWDINAPSAPTNVKKIEVSFGADNKPKFDVEYLTEGSSMKYHAGKRGISDVSGAN